MFKEAFVLSPVPLRGATDSPATEKPFSSLFPGAAYPAQSMSYTPTKSYAPGMLEKLFSWSDALTISRRAEEKT